MGHYFDFKLNKSSFLSDQTQASFMSFQNFNRTVKQTVTALASATTSACPAQTDDIQAPYGSTVDKTPCYDRAL